MPYLWASALSFAADISRVYISENGVALEADTAYTLTGTFSVSGVTGNNVEVLVCLAEGGKPDSAEIICSAELFADGSASVSEGFTAAFAMKNIELILVLKSVSQVVLTSADFKLLQDGAEVNLNFAVDCVKINANLSEQGQNDAAVGVANASASDNIGRIGNVNAGNAYLALQKAFSTHKNVIFVNKDYGKDTYSGKSESIATPDGPKQTLSGAISAAKDGDTVILQGASSIYAWPAQNSISGKTIAITANGNAAIGGTE